VTVMPKLENPAGDFWGGLAAMLVALPSAVAFGVTIYAPLGALHAAQGALAGLLGAMALGLVAPALGGTNRLITAPCAPAAAVLAAFALELIHSGGSVEAALLLMSVLGLVAGGLQILFGAARLGRLIEYMPYPVVSGYLSGVGLIIIASHAIAGRWQAMGGLGAEQIKHVAVPALTLAVLLSIDTLKTCVVLDALTRSRHDSNRELVGQGLGNVASAVVGGIPGAGTMGATLVNISSGAASRFSGIFEGVLALVAFLLLGSLISWVPIAALAAILIVIGVRMIDRNSVHFLRQPSTLLDFAVIAAVVATALTVSLIAASGVGIVLAVFLFIREQIGGRVVRRKVLGNQVFSKRVRTKKEMQILVERGDRAAILELQGSLFFGTANQLYTALEPELKTRRFVILDLRRVQTVDVTAAHMLEQVKDMLAERDGYLIFSQIPQRLPSGKDIQQYFDQVGLIRSGTPVRVFGELDEAMEWVEDKIIAEAALEFTEESALALQEIELFHGRTEETLSKLEQCLEKRSYKAGERIFTRGERGDELFLIRRGAVRIVLPLNEHQHHHLGTFGRGAFFGEMAFLDGEPRSADAVAFCNAEVYVLSRQTFDKFADEHRKAGLALMEGLASVLSSRLRYTNAELRVLES
jgi:sulfate permease, SulP family